jgi:putative flippase GtrA|tara:strand:+ start:326 stop:775 length:450 start_codon:yes stop_codon:yes gene_type:complete
MNSAVSSKVIRLLKSNETKVRFLVTGVLNSSFGLIMFPFFYYFLEEYKLHYLIILTISQFICIIFAYLTNKFLVFKTKGNYASEFLRFITFHISHFSVNLLALPVLVEFFKLEPVIAQIFFAVMVIISSYFWQSKITFRSNDSKMGIKK